MIDRTNPAQSTVKIEQGVLYQFFRYGKTPDFADRVADKARVRTFKQRTDYDRRFVPRHRAVPGSHLS